MQVIRMQGGRSDEGREREGEWRRGRSIGSTRAAQRVFQSKVGWMAVMRWVSGLGTQTNCKICSCPPVWVCVGRKEREEEGAGWPRLSGQQGDRQRVPAKGLLHLSSGRGCLSCPLHAQTLPSQLLACLAIVFSFVLCVWFVVSMCGNTSIAPCMMTRVIRVNPASSTDSLTH